MRKETESLQPVSGLCQRGGWRWTEGAPRWGRSQGQPSGAGCQRTAQPEPDQQKGGPMSFALG